VVTAVATIGGIKLGGVSQPLEPIAGGVITIGDIRLGTRPFIRSIAPTAVLAGTNVSLTVTGDNLRGSTFVLAPAGITVNLATINAAGTLATLAVSVAAATSGRLTLVATNPAGSSDATPIVGFVIGAPDFNTITVPGPDGAADPDKDGLTNSQEIANGTDPLNAETDGDGWVDGLEVTLGSGARNAASVPNPNSGFGYVSSIPFSMLNNVNPGIGQPGSTQYVTSRVFSILNVLNPSTGIPGSNQFVSSLTYSILNSLNPGVGLPGSTQYVTSPVFSMLNLLNPSTGIPGSNQYVSSLTISILNGISPAPSGPVSQSANGPMFSILNGIPLNISLLSGAYVSAERIARTARPWEFQDGLRLPVDSDGDGIPDAEEIQLGINPTDRDTDHDGFPDGLEFVLGSNPLDPSSLPNLNSPRVVVGPAVSFENGNLQAKRNLPALPVNVRRTP